MVKPGSVAKSTTQALAANSVAFLRCFRSSKAITAPVPATTARKMGCFLLTETMARRHELSMKSYDRLFPNQDTMPRGGFGNLIALPFQDGPRQQGNSVFVDETWTPYPDQWAYLASVPRASPADVEALAREASKKNQVVGVRMAEPTE